MPDLDYLVNDLSLDEAMGIVRRRLVVYALEYEYWNICAAARRLKVHRNTLMRMMQTHDIQRPR